MGADLAKQMLEAFAKNEIVEVYPTAKRPYYFANCIREWFLSLTTEYPELIPPGCEALITMKYYMVKVKKRSVQIVPKKQELFDVAMRKYAFESTQGPVSCLGRNMKESQLWLASRLQEGCREFTDVDIPADEKTIRNLNRVGKAAKVEVDEAGFAPPDLVVFRETSE